MRGTDRGVWCTRRRRCYFCLLLLLGVVLVGLCVRYFYAELQSAAHKTPQTRWQPVLVGSRYRFPTAPPYTDFIDPRLDNFKRKFYSGVLVTPRALSERARARSLPNVTIFRLKPGEEDLEGLRSANACVPFHGPGPNRTELKICVYDREVDQMISSYIRDYGVWEKEQVAGMASLLRADEVQRRRSRMPAQRSDDPAGNAATGKEAEGRPLLSEASFRFSADAAGAQGKATGWGGDDSLLAAKLAARKRESLFLRTLNGGRKANASWLRERGDEFARKAAEGILPFRAEPAQQKTGGRAKTARGAESDVRSSLLLQAAGGAVRARATDSEETGLPARMSVVDVGCNVGAYTLSAASLGHPVVAVEPVRSTLRLLAASLRLNHFHSSSSSSPPSSSSTSPSPPSVTLLLNAISNEPGPVTVDVNQGNIGGSSVSVKRTKGSGSGGDRDRDGRDTVWAVCLDHLVPLVPTRRVFLKLDIEGWEERALRCAGGFFQRLDVRYVMMEWLFYRKSSGGSAVIAFLVRNGLLPYADAGQSAVLDPAAYHAWPDNVLWAKR